MPRFTTSDGLSLHYADEGNGLPVLCLAGLTRNGGDFEFLMPYMKGVRVIRLDSRGRGQSDYAKDYKTYSVIQETEDVIDLLDHLGLDRVTVIGTSRGGLIAMVMAALHRDRLSAVVLNDIGPDIAPGGLDRIMDYLGKEPKFANMDAAADGLFSAFCGSFPGVSRARWRRQAELMWQEKPEGGLVLRYDHRLRDAVVAQAKSGPAANFWPLFDALKSLPLATLRGQNSDLLTPETFAKMKAHAPNMLAVTVQNRAHVPFLDEPEAVAAIHRILEHVG